MSLGPNHTVGGTLTTLLADDPVAAQNAVMFAPEIRTLPHDGAGKD